MNISELLSALKQSTGPLHRAVEQAYPFSELLSATVPVVTYHCALRLLFELESAVLNQMNPDTAAAEPVSRWRSVLDQNLARLNGDLEQLSRLSKDCLVSPCANRVCTFPSLSSFSQCVGAFYVLMGSSLGARLIYPALCASSLPESIAHHYFAALARHNGWRSFVQDLTDYLDQGGVISMPEATSTAQRTFQHLLRGQAAYGSEHAALSPP